MFEFLSFLIGIMIMGPIIYIYFSMQDLKKRIKKIEENINKKWENFTKKNIDSREDIIGWY